MIIIMRIITINNNQLERDELPFLSLSSPSLSPPPPSHFPPITPQINRESLSVMFPSLMERLGVVTRGQIVRAMCVDIWNNLTAEIQ